MSRVALVTGGTGGVGPSVLQRLASDSWQVTATYRDEPGTTDDVTFVPCDVTDPDAIADVVAALPRLDAVVHLVGGFASGPKVHESEPDALQKMLDLNLVPAFLVARATMPKLLASRGSFVAVSSSAVNKPFAGAAGYLASKAALITLVEALDAEYGASGVRANVLLPGTLDTPANREAMPKAKRDSWVSPEQFADTVALLLSSSLRGVALPLTGAS